MCLLITVKTSKTFKRPKVGSVRKNHFVVTFAINFGAAQSFLSSKLGTKFYFAKHCQ